MKTMRNIGNLIFSAFMVLMFMYFNSCDSIHLAYLNVNFLSALYLLVAC